MSRRVAASAPDLRGYVYEKLLGSGGFSDVFLYEQQLPRRKVAVKVLLTDQLDQQSRANFVSEANTMAQLSAHPYIVTIYHADVSQDDRPYFVMEYCSGPSLAERYKRERFTVDDVLRIGVRVSSAVATAHAAGILHRDIKPANVLTNDFGWPALTDFGISSTMDDDPLVHTTTLHEIADAAAGNTTRQSVGLSVPWSPPEMFDDDPKPDVRSDVFSLGATLYTLLEGHTPFEIPGRANGTLDLIARIERGAVTPLARADVPRTLTAVLQKSMAARRDDRFATAVDFARALQRVELELGYSPTGIEVPNLAVAAPVPTVAETPTEDETRIRSVSTVVAQPPRPAPGPISTPPAASAPAPDATRVRSAPSVVAQPTAASLPGVGTPREAPDYTVMRRAPAPAAASAEHQAPAQQQEPATVPVTKRRKGLVWGIVAAAAIVVAAGIVAAIIVPASVSKASSTHSPSGGGQIVLSQVPDPAKGAVSRGAGGTSVTFTWSNPNPKPGDSYQWIQQNSANATPTPTDSPTATVTGVSANQSVCITISIVRNGQTSPTPLQECSP